MVLYRISEFVFVCDVHCKHYSQNGETNSDINSTKVAELQMDCVVVSAWKVDIITATTSRWLVYIVMISYSKYFLTI